MSKWTKIIPFDRNTLPEPCMAVLLYTEAHEMHTGWITRMWFGQPQWAIDCGYDCGMPTHWMELPEPPKEE